MVDKIDTAIVKLWGDVAGAVSWMDDRKTGVFEFHPDFLKKGLDISPLKMSLEDARKGDGIFSFPELSKKSFLGLPGLLSDSLPDKFGNIIIDAWLERNGRSRSTFSPVERLCYTGQRGMGALEFSPPVNKQLDKPVSLEITRLVELAQTIMSERSKLNVNIGKSDKENSEALLDILRVGTSAGGARPKAVIAINNKGSIISGQNKVPKGYDCLLLKFDGVSDIELGEPQGYGRIEYAYYLMAKDAGINMMKSSLLEENGRAHFLTRRFDRRDGEKLHLQSLCGIAHFDYNNSGAYSYEQAFSVMRQLRLTKADAIQFYKRMLLNVIARNQDDHTKNTAFIMNKQGVWKLSPAFDVIFAHNPAGIWTNQHQMSINGKRDNFIISDLIKVGTLISISKPSVLIEEIMDSVRRWPEFAKKAGIKKNVVEKIAEYHRLDIS